ncbi:MAG: hypothetical protein Q9213_003117 [Squamulea squamosa]
MGASLLRYRPAILALAAIAIGFTTYAICKDVLPSSSASRDESEQPNGSLHRSNAQRRRRSNRRQSINGVTEPVTRRSNDSIREPPVEIVAERSETESIQSDQVLGDDQDKSMEDQNMLNLLYRIAEDQAKKEGFVHRGSGCNSCNAMPICGIRYRCMNCPDYDLCEQCESLQVHDKTHVFYKIRIPIPFQSNPREAAPVWYPGIPGKVRGILYPELRMKLSTKTGMSERQVDAFWEQFQCLASADYLDDPCGFCVAINRHDFNKCFVPSSTASRPPPANLVYDRTFSFYDTNNDGLIGFGEFIDGIACIANKGSNLRARIFQAYDVDGDGFVTRKDFLRMFRAYYALTKELTAQVVAGVDDEFFDEAEAREILAGSQPISSIFSGQIPAGQPSHGWLGKSMDGNGDLHIMDGLGSLLKTGMVVHPGFELDFDMQDKLVADHAELAQFGNLDPQWHMRIDPHQVLEVGDDQWPKSWLQPQDVRDALGNRNPQEHITDHVDRSLIVCAGIERAQQEGWARAIARRRAVDRRQGSRHFHLDEGIVDGPSRYPTVQRELPLGIPHPDADLRSTRIKLLDHMNKNLNWPEMADYHKQVDPCLRKRMKCHEMAQVLAPTRDDIPLTGANIASLLQELIGIERYLMTLRASSKQSSLAIASPVSKRSRSSSEVKFNENVASDDNDDKNFARGRYDVPGPERDVGRDMIYQITQEAMNELLDPMFRLREELSVEVWRTKRERSLYKHDICSCMHNGFVPTTYFLFKHYQKWWYQNSRDNDIVDDKVLQHFVTFMLKCFKSPKKPGSQIFHWQPNTDIGTEQVEATTPPEVADAIEKVNQVVIDAGFSRPQAASAESNQLSSASPVKNAIRETLPDGSEVTLKLHEGVAASDGTASVETRTNNKPQGFLLERAVYPVANPSPQDSLWSSASPMSSPSRSIANEDELRVCDPTLPQHRPNNVDEWEARYGYQQTFTRDRNSTTPHMAHHAPPGSKSLPLLPDDRRLTLAVWMIIEEDDIRRGGPGRLDLTDFTNIMEGDKGQGLGFVDSWIETVKGF